jgi:endonuclease/exonuclease/phosphatase (EEP) superfamily protein YafD
VIPAAWWRVRLILGGLAVLWGGIVNLFLLGNWLWASLTVFVVLNQIAPWITLFSLLAFSLAFTLRAPRWLVLWLAPGMIAFVWWYAPAWLPKAPAHAKGVEFTAVTYNVLGHLADPEQTFAVIRDTDADLIALEELRPTLQAKLRNDLSDRYPYQVSKVVQGYDGLALLSRFPILESEISLEIDFEHIDLDTPRYLRAVVDIQGRPVAVYVLHPATPAWYTRHLDGIPLEYDDTHLQAHITAAVKKISAETFPVLLLCDCNGTPRSRQYRMLDGILDEAFGARGWGLGLSHPVEPFPLVRIDYIWYTGQFTALDARVWPESGSSDHYPVWGRLVLRSR